MAMNKKSATFVKALRISLLGILNCLLGLFQRNPYIVYAVGF